MFEHRLTSGGTKKGHLIFTGALIGAFPLTLPAEGENAWQIVWVQASKGGGKFWGSV